MQGSDTMEGTGKRGIRPDQHGHNSSWRPPGKKRRGIGVLQPLVLLQLAATYSLNVFAESLEESKSLFDPRPLPIVFGAPLEDIQRQGRNLEDGALRESRPLIKKPTVGLTVRWARSTTSRPRLPRQSGSVVQPNPEHFIKPAFLLPFGRKLTKESPLLTRSKASTQDVIKPSNIRKRNFSAVLAAVVSEEEDAEGATNNIVKFQDEKDQIVPEDPSDEKEDVIDEIKGERMRGAIIRDVSTVVPKKIENDWERSRISIKRPTTETAPVNNFGSRGVANARQVTSGDPTDRPRGRIRLNRSKLGIYQKWQSTTTPRSPRLEDDMPQRPSKRDRIRNLKIRRPLNSNVNSSQSPPSTTYPISTAKTSPQTQHRLTTSAPPASTYASTPQDNRPTTKRTSTTERMLSLKGRVKEYQEIVRTTKLSESTTAATVVTRTKPTVNPSMSASARSLPILPLSTTQLFTTSTTAETTMASTTVTVSSTTTEPDVSTSPKPTTFRLRNVSPEKMRSTLQLLDLTTEPLSISSSSTASSTPRVSSPASQLDEPDGSEIKQSKDHIPKPSLSQSEITTRNPVELPSRPREELKKDLLDAIRRKISRNKVSSLSGQKTTTGFEISGLSQHAQGEVPKSSNLRAERLNTPSFSPSANSVSSTRPPFFRPISFPPRKGLFGNPSNPKVQIFVTIPDNKPGAIVKIPNVSHIQDKLARLNAAITEGLKLEQQEKEREEAIRADWERHSDEEEDSTLKAIETIAEPEIEKPRTFGSISLNVTLPSRAAPVVRTSSTTTTTTTSTTTTSTTTTTTTERTTTMVAPKPIVSKKQDWRKKKLFSEHPSSHFRPENDTDFIPMPKSNLPPKEDIFIVTPKYGMYKPIADRNNATNDTAAEETETIGTGRSAPKESKVLEDITGTTVYVIGIIAIIPAAGLLAWVVRLVIRRKSMGGSESSSETGLNRPITEEDALQITGRAGFSLPSHGFETIAEAPENIPKVDTQDMLGSVWEFPRSRLRLQTVLGEGNFGKVWKAEAEDICGYDGTILVAVKGIKENSAQREKDDLVQEMKIMQEIGPHPNVVTILGVCTQQEPYLLVMEYVMYGKLLTHLREQRMRQSSFFNFSKDGGDVGESLTSKDLNKFSYGVAKGMEFLVQKGIIHRDLAARNILVDHNKNTKISDFGLSRNLRDIGGEMYEQKTKGALPIRWMAPESLYFSVFTPKSDVWGFGILMWEIVTLGSTPYPGMGAREVMRRVRDGYRLERPAHCHPDLYLIIQKCWAGDMNKRPDFSELRKEIAKLLEDQHGYIDLQNIPENKYYSMDQNPDEEEKL